MKSKNEIMYHLYRNQPPTKQGWNYKKRIRGWWKDSLFEVYQTLSDAQVSEANLCEIGVWYGRSLLPFKNFLKANERLIAADIWIRNQKQEVINTITECYGTTNDITFVDGSSLETQDEIKSRGPFRMMYIDGGHKYNEALSDLRLADQTLTADGILWLDDYKNHNFGTDVARAIRTFVNESDFEVVFTSCLQAFLCRSEYKESYLHAMENLQWNKTIDSTFGVPDFAHPKGYNSWEWVDPN